MLITALTMGGLAQDAPPAPEPQPPVPDPKATFFEHSQTSKWWFSGQANFVFQAHGDFYAQYSGTNSLKNYAEHATSRVLTFFSGYEFTPNTMAYLDVEEAGWGGISGALGLAGFTNLDVVRNPSIGAAALYRAADDPADHSAVKGKDGSGADGIVARHPGSSAAIGDSLREVLAG